MRLLLQNAEEILKKEKTEKLFVIIKIQSHEKIIIRRITISSF